jgi:hypothetical protein
MRIAAAAVAVASLGCVPIPGRFRTAPAASGVVTRDAGAVEGALVWHAGMTGDTACPAPDQAATTLPDGSFELAASSRWRLIWVAPLPVDYGTRWRLCIREGRSSAETHQDFWTVGPPLPPSSVRYACRLEGADLECNWRSR